MLERLLGTSDPLSITNGKVIEYVYRDRQGNPLYRKLRGEGKRFWQEVWEDGEWVLGGWKGQPVLYRQDEIVSHPGETVWIVEGEKDADNLWNLGLVATTLGGASSPWDRADLSPLRGLLAVILPDNDGPGQGYGLGAYRVLQELASSVRVVNLPGLPPGGDVSDWLASGHTIHELWTIIQKPDNPILTGVRGAKLSERTPKETAWLWQGRVPLGNISCIAGDAGIGKSTLTLDIASRASRGTLRGGLNGTPVRVALATAEDGLDEIVLPRLIAAGADLELIESLEFRDESFSRSLILPKDLDGLRSLVMEREIKLVIIDPLLAHVSGVDKHTEDMRQVLAPLAKLAEESGAAIWYVCHLNRRDTSDPLQRVMGATSIAAAARSVLLSAANPSGGFLLTHAKCNVGPMAPSLQYNLEQVGAVARVNWGEENELTAHDVLTSSEDRTKLQEACEDLRVVLEHGPVHSRDVEKYMERRGHKAHTIRRARLFLGIKPRREGGLANEGRWVWELPKHS